MAKLQSTQLKSLPVGSHSDGDGLLFRVLPSGRRCWALQYSSGRQRKKVTIGRFPDIQLSEARTRALQMRANIKSGFDPNAQRQRAGTVQAAIDAYSQHPKFTRLKPTTKSQYQLYLREEIGARFGQMNLTDLKREHVARLIAEIEASGRQPTATAVYRVFRRFLNWCVRTAALIEDNPCLKLEPPSSTPNRDRVLSDAEITALLTCVAGRSDPYATLIQLLFWTGCRRSEIATLRWRDIDMEERVVTLANTKNGRTHLVPLCDQAFAYLQSLPKAGEYLVSGTLGRKPFSGFAKSKNRLDSISGVKSWRLHDIRRSVATRISELGFSREVLRAVLNHADQSVTGIYDRYEFLPEKKQALQAVADRIERLQIA